jgi:hypothetical protein
VKIVRSRDLQSFPVESAGVFFAADQSPYLRDARQVRRVKTADGSTANYTNTLHR